MGEEQTTLERNLAKTEAIANSNARVIEAATNQQAELYAHSQ